MPEMVNKKTIKIVMPGEDDLKEVDNPLLNYHFQKNEGRSGSEEQAWFKEPV